MNATWERRIATAKAMAKNARVGEIGVTAAGSAVLVLLVQGIFGSSPDIRTTAQGVVNKSAAVSSFAQDCVSVWLQATSKDVAAIQECTPIQAGELKLSSTPQVVIDTPTIVAVTDAGAVGAQGDGDLYSVIIGVTQRPFASASPTRALYRVPVLFSDFGARAVTLPARVSGLGAGADLATAYPVSLGPQDALYGLAGDFLTAYLTPAGAVNRFVTSDSGITALRGAYKSVWTTSVSATAIAAPDDPDGTVIHLLVRANASAFELTDEARKRKIFPPSIQMTYPLTVTKVAGQWSISSIDESPQMSNEDELVPVAAPPGN